MSNSSSERKLNGAPNDGISNVVYSTKRSSNQLLVSSWDTALRLYDTKENKLQQVFEQKKAILDCAFGADDKSAYSGGLDGLLVQAQFETGDQTVVGSHSKAIKCVEYLADRNVAVTGSWDCSVKGWDVRASSPQVFSITQPECKVYTMAHVQNRVVVGTSGRAVHIYDVRNMSRPEQVRESSLMNQTRCIRCFPDGQGFVISSIDGRVAVELFDLDPIVQARKYAFKCHRKTDKTTKVQTLYPVNSIAFHPIHGTFASGGCDGLINIWDGHNRKRICQFSAYDTSIAAMAFNSAGDTLAIAVSYTFEQGEKPDVPEEKIILKSISSSQVMPKKRARA